MKNNVFFITLFIIVTQISLSNHNFNVQNFNGDCNDSDSTLNYKAVIYFHTEVDTTIFSTILTQVQNLICGSQNTVTNLKIREHINFCKTFTHNSSTYTIDTNQITLHKIYTSYDSTSEMDYHVFELRNKSNGTLLSIDYGSLEQNTNGTYLSYLMVCDTSNPYASEYIGANLTYTQIFNSGGGYLWEITDDDRNDMLVGLKYKSPFGSTIYEKFLVPNP